MSIPPAVVIGTLLSTVLCMAFLLFSFTELMRLGRAYDAEVLAAHTSRKRRLVDPLLSPGYYA